MSEHQSRADRNGAVTWFSIFLGRRRRTWLACAIVCFAVFAVLLAIPIVCRRSALPAEPWDLGRNNERFLRLFAETLPSGATTVFDSEEQVRRRVTEGAIYSVIAVNVSSTPITHDVDSPLMDVTMLGVIQMSGDVVFARSGSRTFRYRSVKIADQWTLTFKEYAGATKLNRDEKSLWDALSQEMRTSKLTRSDPVLQAALASPNRQTTRPHWPGIRFVVHHYYWQWAGVIWAAAAMLLLPLPIRAAALRARSKRGRCLWCAYDRQGLAAASPCPECGRHNSARQNANRADTTTIANDPVVTTTITPHSTTECTHSAAP